MRITDTIGYEQMKALQILRRSPNIEGYALCKEADLSFSELYDLAYKTLIDIGAGRVSQNRVNPTLTDYGRSVVDYLELEGII